MRRALLVVFLLLSLLPSTSSATLLIYMPDEELTARADAVVLAEVLSVTGYRDARRDRVFTRVTLDVEEYWKGEGPDRIAVRVAGGTVGDLEYRVLGAPRFAVGEKVVLFLTSRSEGNAVIGMAQGKLRVVTDDRGETWLDRDIASIAFVARDGRTPVRHATSNRVRLSTLRAVIARVAPVLPAAPQRPLAGASVSE